MTEIKRMHVAKHYIFEALDDVAPCKILNQGVHVAGILMYEGEC